MMKYWKAAFFARFRLPGLGAVPCNLVGLVCLGILGLAHPGFLLLGAGLELAYLHLLGDNPAFRQKIDGLERQERLAGLHTSAEEEDAPAATLSGPDRKRLNELRHKCAQTVDKMREHATPKYALDNTAEALDKLCSGFTRLLAGRAEYLRLRESVNDADLARESVNDADLAREITALEQELAATSAATHSTDTRVETLRILRRRRDNLVRCHDILEGIDDNLQRIEAQVSLAYENAVIGGSMPDINTDLAVASFFLDDEVANPTTHASSATLSDTPTTAPPFSRDSGSES